jgi:hypothetical protein
MDASHLYGVFADAADRLAVRIDAAAPVTICGELTETTSPRLKKNAQKHECIHTLDPT